MIFITDTCELILKRENVVNCVIKPITPYETIQLLNEQQQEEINTLITDEDTNTFLMKVLGLLLPMRKITKRPKSGDYILLVQRNQNNIDDAKLYLIEIL